MLLNDVDLTSVSKSVEDAFSAKRDWNRGGKQDKWNNNKRKIPVFKGKCHNCLEKGHYVRENTETLCPKKNTERANRKGKNGSAFYAEKDDNLITEDKALFTSNLLDKSRLIIDSGATQHMTFEKSQLSDYGEFKQPSIVDLWNKRSILANGKGTYHVVADLGDWVQNISFRDVLYLPDFERNLLSIRAMVKLGAKVEFVNDECKITRNVKLPAVGRHVVSCTCWRLFIKDEHVNVAREESDLNLWHCRLGHLGMEKISKMMDGNMVYGINATKDNVAGTCEPCVMGKQHRTPYRKVTPYQAAGPFGIVHSDACVPMHVNSFGNSRYYVTFIDDYSRYTCVYFIYKFVYNKFRIQEWSIGND